MSDWEKLRDEAAQNHSVQNHPWGRQESFIAGADWAMQSERAKGEKLLAALKEVQAYLDVVTYNEPMKKAHDVVKQAIAEYEASK